MIHFTKFAALLLIVATTASVSHARQDLAGALTLTGPVGPQDLAVAVSGVSAVATFPDANVLSGLALAPLANTAATTQKYFVPAGDARWTDAASTLSAVETANDPFVVAVTPVPEPGTWAAGFLTLAAIAYTARRRLVCPGTVRARS
jgi:hypothetical protein